ncbi:hypothetical protein BKA56DRAFT_607878 [Ilyonectria sp. MPI-CAGE-AT-0026]|nr:hypothetical protein BKA56DRAFT_607878 [Ilyonectria sp. MPI-CAGE-AT-0026]
MPASPNTCTRQDGRRRSGGVCFAALTVESVLVPEGLCRSLRAQILGNPPCINHNRDRDPVASWSRDVDTTSQARSALLSTPSATSQYFSVSDSVGEQTAAALEANLSHLEDKLEAILAALEANEAEQLKAPKPNKADNNGKTLSGNGPAEDDADKGKTA